MPPQERLWLDNNDGLFPAPNYPGQKNQKQPVRFAAGRSFHLSPEDDERLSKERIFCDEFRFPSGKVCQRTQNERARGRSRPVEEVGIERLKAVACQSLDGDKNTMHSRRFLLVMKMRSECLLILLLLWLIRKWLNTLEDILRGPF